MNQWPQIDSHLTAKLYFNNTIEEPSLVRNNQGSDFNDIILTNVDSITVNRNSTSGNELVNKNYTDDSIGEDRIVRFNQTLQKYLKVSVGNITYNLTKYDKIQLTDRTIVKTGNTGATLLSYWRVICNDVNNNGKSSKFLKSTESGSPTCDTGATSLPPIGIAVFI